MDLKSVLQALRNADAAGDTAAATRLAQIAQQLSPPASEPDTSGFKPDYTYGEIAKKGIVRGAKQLGSTFGDIIPAMGASALGFDDYAKRQMEEAKQTQEEISKSYAPQYGSLSDVKGISDVPGFALETIAEQVPNIATSLIPGVGGAALAGRTATTAAAKALAAQAAERGLAGEAATAFVNQGLKQAAPQLAAKAELGQNAGIFLGSYAQNAPEVFQNIYDKTGELAPGASMLFGAGSAALDSVLPAKLMNKLTGPMKVGIIEKVLEKSGMDKGLLRSVSAGMMEAAGAEGLTEGMQEAISIAAENFVGKNPQIFGSKEWDRIMESSVRGAVGGGAFGALGGGIEAGRRGKERQEQYQEALGKRQARQLAAEVGRMGQQIEGLQAGQAQQELPGFETGPATGLLNLPVSETDQVKALREKYEGIKPPKELKGTQQELFTEQGTLTPAVEKAATKDEKAEINKQRLAEQREAAEVKEAQKKLKAALAELTDTPTDLVSLAQQPSPLAQTIGQVQSENAALAAKRGPKAVQPTTTPTTVTQPNVNAADVTTAVTEPVVVQKPVPPTPQQLPTVINDEALKGLGIGHTALIRKNKLLEGKDIAIPGDAAEVKRILTAYAENRSQPIKEKIDAFLARPEFQGAENVAPNVEQPTGASPAIPSEPNNLPSTESTGLTEPSGVVSPVAATGETVGRESQQPRTLTDRQQRIEFGKALGAAQSYPGMLRGRMNPSAQTAAKNGDFTGVVNALEKSKNATVAEVARRAKGLSTKIQIDDAAGETYEGRSAFEDQMSIDGAKMHLDALNKLRQLAPVVNQLPDGASLPYEIARTPIETYSNGEKHYSQLNLSNIVDNNNSMFTGLNLPEGRTLRTKEDFKALIDAFERTTQELGEDKLRLTSTASSIQQGVAGRYSADTDTIHVPEYYAKDEHVLAHEIVHAQVLNAVANPTKEQKPVIERLNKLYEHVKAVVEKQVAADKYFRSPYGITNQQEFISEGLSNPDFQYLLSRIQYENTSVWDKFVEAIAKLLGLKNDSAFTELLTVYSELTQKGETLGDQTIETQQTETQGQEAPAAKSIGKKAAADKIKAEQGAVAAEQERTKFVEDNDKKTDSVMRGILLDIAGKLGVKPQDLPAQSQIGTDEHNMLRLPALLNRYIDLQDIIAKAEEPEQTAKNQRELEGVAKAIAASGGDAPQLLSYLQGLPQKQRDTVISSVTRKAISDFEDRAKDIVEAHIAETKKKLETVEEYTDADAARDADLINEALYQKLGIRLWSPVYVGPELDETGRSLAQKGDLNSLLGHLGNTIKTPEIQRVLRKIQSLGLKTKIVIGDLQGKAGSYDPVTNTITLDPTNGLNAHTVIHEVTHAAISHVLDNPNHPLTKEFTKFFEQVKNQFGSAYGANSLQEFAAELTGNPEFQSLLKTIKAPRSENMFVRIMQSVAEFLGFRKGQSAYDAGLKFVNNAIDISKDVKPNNADVLFFGMGPAVSSGLNAVGNIGKSMPQLVGKTLEDARNTFSNISNKNSPMYMGPSATNMLFGLLRLDNLNTMYGKALPSIQKLLDALEMRNGSQEQRIAKANQTYKKFMAVQKAHPQGMERLNQLAYDASLEEIDLADPNFKPTPSQAAKAAQMRAAFNSLPADVRNVYTTVRGFYEGSLKEYEKFLLSSVSPTLATKLKLQFETRKKLTGYIPFLRRGDFWVEYVDPASGERAASAFQSIRERQQFVNDVLKNQPHKLYQNLQQIAFNGTGVPPGSFLGTIMADLQKKGASQQQLDSVYQSYLALFPAQSIAKQFMKRDNVRGMERDIIRAYGDVSVKWARKLANSEYSAKIDGALEEIGAQAQNANRDDVYAAANNIQSQSNFYHNPTFGALTHGATTLSYFEFIAGNVSSALVNLTSLPMLVWPMLGGKYGIGNASTAMLNASKVAVNQWQNNPKYKALYQALMDHAQLEHTTAREVLEGRRETTAEFTGVKAKILEGLALPFSATEKYNRATTAIAAYDLAKQNGKSEQDAIREAITAVKDVHTSGIAATAPKWMQHPLGRVAFTFKSFVWNSAFVMARAFHQAYKGENKQVRDAARKQLLATYGMAMAFGGAKGLPFYGAMSTLATMIHALFGDDDEPYDFNEQMRDTFGEFLYKGPLNYATNLELSNRVGIATDLIYRDDPRSVADHGFALTAIQQALGPAASYAVNADKAIKMMNEGHTERAIESLVPSFVRNGMKGFRYMTEGAKTLKGDPIEEDIGAYNSVMQAFGFSPANLSSTYEKTSAAKAFEKEVLQRRVRLLNLYDMALTAGDTQMMSEVNDGISAFNAAHPTERITGETKQRSLTARKNAEKNMINGVAFNKKLRPEIEAKFFEED